MLEGLTIGAVVPAAGKGKRMGGGKSKQFLELEGKPILVHTLERLNGCEEIDRIVVVAEADSLQETVGLIRAHGLSKVVSVVPGGEERQDSVWNGLEALSSLPECALVLIHDAVRPFVTATLIRSSLEAAIRCGAAVAAVPPKETLKQSADGIWVGGTPDRDGFWVAQTPQVFRYQLLVEAYRSARQEGFRGTDDSSLVERTGTRVMIVRGDYDNIKITTQEDLELALGILRRFTF
jgi:2-C-methyl-D-erythritol 4-phosphate cytidylyltransferase